MLGPCEARRGAVDLTRALISAVRTGRARGGEGEEVGEGLGDGEGEEAGGMVLGGCCFVMVPVCSWEGEGG